MASLASGADLQPAQPYNGDPPDQHSFPSDLAANLSLSNQFDRFHLRRSSLTQATGELGLPLKRNVSRTTTTTTAGLANSGNSDEGGATTTKQKKREVYRFRANWLVSSLAWSNEPGETFNLALCSYIEEYKNQVQLVTLTRDDCGQELESVVTFEHSYPATKILWIPRPSDSYVQLPRLLATTADYLRLWRVIDNLDDGNGVVDCDLNGASRSQQNQDKAQVKLECLLNTNQGTKHCSPLTSFDWNDIDPTMIVTASVDTTCAIWDIELGKQIGQVSLQNHQPQSTTNLPTENANIYCNLRNQIVAHDHEVYDVSFSSSGSGRDVFASSGGDGSVRLFDLRKLSTSKVLYEMNPSCRARPIDAANTKALVRVSCNKKDPNYIGAFAIDSKDLIILDLRYPGRPVAALSSHTAELNSMSWAPHSAHHICTASSDHQALIWELSKLPSPVSEPLLAYRANGKINTVSWSAAHSDWIAIGFENYLELLRV